MTPLAVRFQSYLNKYRIAGFYTYATDAGTFVRRSKEPNTGAFIEMTDAGYVVHLKRHGVRVTVKTFKSPKGANEYAARCDWV